MSHSAAPRAPSAALSARLQIVVYSACVLALAGCATRPELTRDREDLNSPPPVTAKAWAIADGRTGAMLWGFNADEPRKSASTTKMMCALVVLELAAKTPAVLDERVTFSKLAGTTGGSTAAVKPGESLTVRDCLRGLMLPSGNDAGNALAEHFNARFAKPDGAMLKFGLGETNLATRANFIAEMNRVARRIGLNDTKYRSSFGDGGTEADRTTTVRDLTRLAWHAMKNAHFREIVATRRYGCDVRMPDGGTRKATWENTNQLLGLDMGYDGVKTGTTTQAGTCLVSRGNRGGDQLILAVLGCESDNGRYADARNLFRWAWLKRGHKN